LMSLLIFFLLRTKQHVGAWTKVVSFNDAGLLLVESAGSEGGDGAVIAAVDADDGQLGTHLKKKAEHEVGGD